MRSKFVTLPQGRAHRRCTKTRSREKRADYSRVRQGCQCGQTMPCAPTSEFATSGTRCECQAESLDFLLAGNDLLGGGGSSAATVRVGRGAGFIGRGGSR